MRTEAYTTLYDDEARRKYDKKLNEPEMIAQPRPCHVPVYHPPPMNRMPTMPVMPTGVAPMPHSHLYLQTPPHHFMAHVHVQHCMVRLCYEGQLNPVPDTRSEPSRHSPESLLRGYTPYPAFVTIRALSANA